MSGNRDLQDRRLPGDPHRIVRERLSGTSTELTSFFFRHGANMYVFSYEKEGVRKHTFIDAGDLQYRDRISEILAENAINPGNIERIIITHRHRDHCGLADFLAAESGAKIMVHSNFRSFIEGTISIEERRWLGGLDPSGLRACDIEYLQPSGGGEVVNIGGVDFTRLGELIEMGEVGRLEILACPESAQMHSRDQIIALYSPRTSPYTCESTDEGFRPTDDIIFSGDLWLMRGPLFAGGMGNFSMHFRLGMNQMRNLLSGRGMMRRDPREQDSAAKEALKRGFCLIRVEPGHGEEFLGSRILPKSLLAERDLLMEMGYPLDADKSILKSRDMVARVTARVEQAYTSFIEELSLWRQLGYTPSEITGLLARIYREQSGGGPLVEQDRKERRQRLKTTLSRLRDDEAQPDELRELAESTLRALS
jgi:hypothetical protein